MKVSYKEWTFQKIDKTWTFANIEKISCSVSGCQKKENMWVKVVSNWVDGKKNSYGYTNSGSYNAKNTYFCESHFPTSDRLSEIYDKLKKNASGVSPVEETWK